MLPNRTGHTSGPPGTSNLKPSHTSGPPGSPNLKPSPRSPRKNSQGFTEIRIRQSSPARNGTADSTEYNTTRKSSLPTHLPIDYKSGSASTKRLSMPSVHALVPEIVVLDADADDDEQDELDMLMDDVESPGRGKGSIVAPVAPTYKFPPQGGLQRETTSFGVYSNLSSHTSGKPSQTSKLTLNNGGTEQQSEMERCTTSLGVFSNLSSHSQIVEEEEEEEEDNHLKQPHKMDSPLQKRLLDFILTADTAQTRFILDNNPRLSLEFVDERGDTILHHVIRCGNETLIRILMGRKLPVNFADKNGETPLFMAAKQGLSHIVHLLLRAGADPDIQNQSNQRTALHAAAAGGHRSTVELLIYYGARTDVKDQSGCTPSHLCDGQLSKLDFDHIQHSVANRKMVIQELSTSGTTEFHAIGLSIEAMQSGPGKNVLVTCARSERCGVHVSESDDIISDTFAYHIGALESAIDVKVSVPIFYKPVSATEEVMLQTTEGEIFRPLRIVKSNNGFSAVFKTRLSSSGAFVATCRPMCEQLTFSKTSTMVKSSLDERVKLHVDKSPFSSETMFTLQTLEPSESVTIDDDQVLSSTPFYRISCQKKLSKSVTVELPEPSDYGGTGDVLVLIQADDKETRDGGTWQPTKHAVSSTSASCVTFTVKCLPVIAVVVKVKKKYDEATLVNDVKDTYVQILKKTCTACFLCLSKCINPKTEIFETVIECCDAKMLDPKVRHWMSKGFSEHQFKNMIDGIVVCPKQAFIVTYYDDYFIKTSKQSLPIEFHPKRDNIVKFEMNGQRQNAKLFIHFDVKVNTCESPEVACIDIRLSTNKPELDSGIPASLRTDYTRSKSFVALSKKAPSGNGKNGQSNQGKVNTAVFLTDALVGTLLQDLDMDWFKIYVLLAIPFVDIEQEILFKTGNIKDLSKDVLLHWRDEHQADEGFGIPLLNAALFKGGRRDIAANLQIQLKQWYDACTDTESTFYKWVSKAYSDSNILVPSDYPAPMSDAYVVLMSDDLPPSRDLAKALLLTESETNELLSSGQYFSDQIRVMKMLILFRENSPSRIDALARLIQSLENLEYTSMKQYAVMCAKAWVKRTATRKDDPLRYQVDNLLKKN